MKQTVNKNFIAVVFCFSLIPLKLSYAETVPQTNKKTIPNVSQSIQKLHGQELAINFNNASLQTIAQEIEHMFKIRFITDDVIKKADGTPLAPGLADHKVTFTTNESFTAIQSLNLFKTFLEMAGFSMVATNDPEIYRIAAIDQANKMPLPTYINTPLEAIPDNDTRIRYVLLVVNNTPTQIKAVIDKFKSNQAIIELFQDLQAIIIVDKGHNVRGLVEIAKELDTVIMPETLVVKRLQIASADEVKSLVDSLRQKDETKQPAIGLRKPQSINYFPQDVKLIPARGDTLILLGSKEGIKRIEDFIDEHIDIEIKIPYNPLHVRPLNYAMAEHMANILKEAVRFGKVEAGTPGSSTATRYFSNISIEAEKQSNSLIIKSSKEDYALLEPLIASLDVQQPQVAIEVMILSVSTNKNRKLGSQMHSRSNGTITWTTSGFMNQAAATPITVNDTSDPHEPGDYSLVANLLYLVDYLNKNGQRLAGTTLVSLGKTSVWALFGMLQQVTEAKIISNPFLVATNKYRASVALGTTRLVRTQTITSGSGTGQAGYKDITAKLEVDIIPQINEYGIINLDINILIESFTEPDLGASGSSPSLGNKEIKTIKTNANVADGEVLALGGLARSANNTTRTGTPLLESIPLIGNLFSNQSTENGRDMLVIFVAPKIIQSSGSEGNSFTINKSKYLQENLAGFNNDDKTTKPHDPIQRWFFDAVKEPQLEEFTAFAQGGRKSITENLLFKNIEEEKIAPQKISQKTPEKIIKTKKAAEPIKTITITPQEQTKPLLEEKIDIAPMEEKKKNPLFKIATDANKEQQ
jgi:general secretion pathway protein D